MNTVHSRRRRSLPRDYVEQTAAESQRRVPLWHMLAFLVLGFAPLIIDAATGQLGPTAKFLDPGPLKENELLGVVHVAWIWFFYVLISAQSIRVSLLASTLKVASWLVLLRDLEFGVLVAAGLLLADVLLRQILHPAYNVHNLTPVGIGERVVWVGIALTAGITEEVQYRGYLLRELRLRFGNASLAIIAQAVVFGLGHSYEGPLGVGSAFVDACIWGAIAQKCGNLRIPIVAHCVCDLAAGLL